MNYLIMDSEQEASARSEQAAIDKNIVGYTTIWGFIPDHNSDKAALCIHGDYLYLLTEDEKDSLVDELPEGWLKNPFE